jgi:hypothetical protein
LPAAAALPPVALLWPAVPVAPPVAPSLGWLSEHAKSSADASSKPAVGRSLRGVLELITCIQG